MLICVGVRGFACWRQNCTAAKTPGGLEMVWKWSGFPGARAGARVCDPQKNNDFPSGEQKSVQNRSGFGGRFLIFEKSCAGWGRAGTFAPLTAVFAEVRPEWRLDVWPKSDDGGMRFSTETENCTGLKMSGGAEAVQKRCSFAALRRSGTKTGPFPVRYRGGGIRFPEDRGGVEATRRVKLDRRRKYKSVKNGKETVKKWFGLGQTHQNRKHQ